MATVTPPSSARKLIESQQRVRHPLQRIRGTIRTYVGLEGTALLVLLVALWFWFTFIFDFGFFRLFGWDWVQEVPFTWVRAVSIGALFLLGVVAMRFGLLRRVYGKEAATILATAFATSKKRQTFPVWMRIPAVGILAFSGLFLGGLLAKFALQSEYVMVWVVAFVILGVLLIAIGSALVISATLKNQKLAEYDRAVGGLVGGIALILAGCVLVPGLGAFIGAVLIFLHELFGVRSSVSRWVRAPVAAGLSAAMTLLGFWLMLSDWSVLLGVILTFGVGAILGDLVALVSIGLVATLVRGQGYLISLTIPCVLAYLLGWLIAGLVAPSIFAPMLVVLLMVGPVIAVVAVRLLHDFSDTAIALVLERRFPKKLGDRLITAVELANPKRSARYGYSQVMIEQTIHDAAERVAEVPVSKVFDWNRLGRYWMGAAAATLGLYLLAGVLFFVPFMGHAAVVRGGGFGAFHTTAGLVLERDLLLRSITWPRRAYIEVLDWPKNERREKYVGRDETAFALKVRAYKWVVADSGRTEGWRPLTWTDLENNPKILGKAVPPASDLFREKLADGRKDWGQPRDSELGWTLDEIELRLGNKDTHETLDAQTHDTLRDTLSDLKARADDPSMRRVVRTLELPAQVRISYHGERDSGELTLEADASHEYTGKFPELKDSVYFTARGLDFETPRYRIKVDPPPALVELQVDEERPAYPLYRVPTDKDATFLQGQKQQMERWSVSVSGGDTSRIETILTGSNLVLTGTTDKRLRSVAVDVPRGGAAPVTPANVALIDSDKFQVRFTDLGRFQLTDAALLALRDEVPEAARPILDGLKNKPFNSQKDLELQLWNGLMPLLAESAAQYERLKDELLERTPPDQRETLAAKVQAKSRDYTALAHVPAQVVDKARPPSSYDFYFRFVDEQGIKGDRHIIITPQEDLGPTVEVNVNVLRQKGGVYLVTPTALLPLYMKVKDDRGLRQVVYATTLEQADARKEINEGAQGIIATGVMELLPGGPGQEIAAAARLAALSKEKDKTPNPNPEALRAQVQRFPAGYFAIEDYEYLPTNVIADILNKPLDDNLRKELHKSRNWPSLTKEFLNEHPEEESIRKVDVDDPNLPPEERKGRLDREEKRVAKARSRYLDISQVKDPQGRGLATEDADGKQRPYIINVWVEALDNDIETGKVRLEAADGPNGVKLDDGRDPIALVKTAVDKETTAMEALAHAVEGIQVLKDYNAKEKGGAERLAAIEAARAKLSEAVNIGDRRQDRANKGRNTATLKFKLVSDNDLVAEIENQEGAEGGPYDRLDTMLKTLNATRDTLGQVVKEWSDKPDGDQFDAMIARTERVMQVIGTNEGEIRDFQALYQRLYKECEVNQISDDKKTKKVGDIVNSLEAALTGKEWDEQAKKQREASGTYPGTRNKLAELRGELGNGNFVNGAAKAKATAEDAQDQLQRLIQRLEKVQANIPKSVGLAFIIKQLEHMDEVDLAHQQEVIEIIAKKLEEAFDK